MAHREYHEDQSIQDARWTGDYSAVRIRVGGHGACNECDRDVNCDCEQDYRVHWCQRHSTMESE